MKYTFLLLITLAFCSCEKEDNVVTPVNSKVTFYRSVGGSWNLIIDGNDKGFLAWSSIAPQCEMSGFTTLNLTVGTHTFDLKSNDGLAWGDPKEFKVVAGCQVVKAVY